MSATREVFKIWYTSKKEKLSKISKETKYIEIHDGAPTGVLAALPAHVKGVIICHGVSRTVVKALPKHFKEAIIQPKVSKVVIEALQSHIPSIAITVRTEDGMSSTSAITEGLKRKPDESQIDSRPAKKARLEKSANAVAEPAQAAAEIPAAQIPADEISDDGASLLALLSSSTSATSLPVPAATLPVPSASITLFSPKPIVKRVEDLEAMMSQLQQQLSFLQSDNKEFKSQLGM